MREHRKFEFTEECRKFCPKVHQYVLGHLAVEAQHAIPSERVSYDSIEGAIQDGFEQDLSFIYDKRCEGPVQQEDGDYICCRTGVATSDLKD